MQSDLQLCCLYMATGFSWHGSCCILGQDPHCCVKASNKCFIRNLIYPSLVHLKDIKASSKDVPGNMAAEPFKERTLESRNISDDQKLLYQLSKWAAS